MEPSFVEETDISVILQYLECMSDLNAFSKNGWTSLMLAALQSSSAIARLLLKHGADPNFTTRSEENPSRPALAVAISNGRIESVQVLVAHGADIHTRDAAGLTAAALAEKLALRPFRQDEMASIASFLRDSVKSSVPRLLEPVSA